MANATTAGLLRGQGIKHLVKWATKGGVMQASTEKKVGEDCDVTRISGRKETKRPKVVMVIYLCQKADSGCALGGYVNEPRWL